ncbi:Crp/Fnr family transcriptional regulator [Aurantiacibacter suaedae]|uniref:Crp/Fnr family transcriptional regulator n=1 Tax=Aurantiacibacter suaedae TaxID=2545755 RepID=UPI001386F473|nr:Crp/Fnr family transcriptional regulator [Aurantiacibacter suaedae]
MSTLDVTRDHLVFVASGPTKLVVLDAAGSEQIVAFQFGGDCLTLPREGLHAYRLVAIRSASLLVFEAGPFRALERQAPILNELMARCTLAALQRTRANLVAMGRRSATERVASFLLSMREIEQVTQSDGRLLTLEMTRQEIADCLGLTVETVSRQFSKLRAMGLIATPSRTQVRLSDPAQLAAQAGAFAPAA